MTPARIRTAAAASAVAALVLTSAACATDNDTADSDDHAADSSDVVSDSTEAASVTPRLVLTYDGGVQILDATSLEEVGDVPLDGFVRVNPAGDGQHIAISTSAGFQLLDAGTWAQAHGDHSHYFTSDPVLTEVTYPAEVPGHAVVHDGRTIFWDDGTGSVTAVDSEHVVDGPDGDVHARNYTTPEAHHGVAVELTDGTLVLTDGTEDERSGVRVLDVDDNEIAATEECPGVHGEATAQGEVVVLGCEDGAVMVQDGKLTKIDSPTSPGGIGSQAGTEESPINLGDYSESEDENPTRVSLIDTESAEMRLVDLPASYSFRSLARGHDGEALVLGTDGNLHVIDPASGEIVNSWPVVDEWEIPEDWQEARPSLLSHEGTAYITDPASKAIHAVDIETGEIWNTTTLDVVPNEITVATGAGVAEHADAEHADDEHADDEHADDEHDH